MIGPLALLAGLAAAAAAPQEGKVFHRPYERADLDLIYNLLFCDDRELFRPKGGEPGGPLGVVLAARPSVEDLRRVARDETIESRIRALAFERLREAKAPVPARILLGVVVEYPLEQGLDVLGVFQDGRVRYINQTGKLAVFEALPASLRGKHQTLIKASGAAIGRIGPWDEARLPPPGPGLVRLTFLASDGLYFGEGPPAAISQDAIGGPVLRAATELLLAIVDASTKSPSP